MAPSHRRCCSRHLSVCIASAQELVTTEVVGICKDSGRCECEVDCMAEEGVKTITASKPDAKRELRFPTKSLDPVKFQDSL